jgi:hypothetical protein
MQNSSWWSVGGGGDQRLYNLALHKSYDIIKRQRFPIINFHVRLEGAHLAAFILEIRISTHRPGDDILATWSRIY